MKRSEIEDFDEEMRYNVLSPLSILEYFTLNFTVLVKDEIPLSGFSKRYLCRFDLLRFRDLTV